jgi:adenine-specific DNA-methyltransferase
MNYIGSKHSLLPFIEQVFRQIRDGNETTACDIFAGTGAVGRLFKRLGLRVVANDLQYYAFALNKAYIEINEQPRFTKLRQKYKGEFPGAEKGEVAPVAEALSFINSMPGAPGFITNNYGPSGGRFYYTEENARKADAIRQAIEGWFAEGTLREEEYFYLLCSLLEAADQVANTASVYGAFLKKFKQSATRPLTLKPLALYNHVEGCRAFRRDANELIKEIECDLLYLDPPYNHRQYGANYHVLETIAAYDDPELRGVTGMRDYPRSRYCKPRAAREALERLIAGARARHILMSYNDEGVLSFDEIRAALSLRGEPVTFSQPYNRFKADSNREYKRDATVEHLHYVRVVN